MRQLRFRVNGYVALVIFSFSIIACFCELANKGGGGVSSGL